MFNFVKPFSEKCKTIGGDDVNKTCIFPFIDKNGIEFTTCKKQSDGFVCSTLVDETGAHVYGQGKWGYCGPNCPMPRTKC